MALLGSISWFVSDDVSRDFSGRASGGISGLAAPAVVSHAASAKAQLVQPISGPAGRVGERAARHSTQYGAMSAPSRRAWPTRPVSAPPVSGPGVGRFRANDHRTLVVGPLLTSQIRRVSGRDMPTQDNPMVKAARVQAQIQAQIPAVKAVPQTPYIAIIIDDVGHDLQRLDQILALPAPVTLAILPDSQFAQLAAERARAAGHEVFLHLPMEPSGLADPGPLAVTSWLTADDIERRVTSALAAVPGARGLNNHMGSRMSACRSCMDTIAAIAVERDLMVVDSLTAPNSQLFHAARAANAPAAKRDVFLDHDRSPGAIAAALNDAQARAMAKPGRPIVAIGHPHQSTLAALSDWMVAARASGVDVGPVGPVMARNPAAGT